jgi:hypothetical protein
MKLTCVLKYFIITAKKREENFTVIFDVVYDFNQSC